MQTHALCDFEPASDEQVDVFGPMPALPVPSTRRWTVRRKAAVIEAVRGGWVPVEEVCRLYMPSGGGSTRIFRPASGGGRRRVPWTLKACETWPSDAEPCSGPRPRKRREISYAYGRNISTEKLTRTSTNPRSAGRARAARIEIV